MLTYCTNIHPGESWPEVFRTLQHFVPTVKAAVSPDTAFPLGLRLSARAIREVGGTESQMLLEWCAAHDCFVATLNGFPYGPFHGEPVKERVYLPDWRSAERVDYTNRLADRLTEWLPAGIPGSISTVPVGFGRCVAGDDLGRVRANLLASLEHLDRLRQHTGKDLALALEPEPGCVLETTGDLVRFVEALRLPGELSGTLGACFDCCHHAVAFESPATALGNLREAGVRVAKVQVSSALRVDGRDAELLRPLCEPTYLHQTVIRRRDGCLDRHDDLPAALASGAEPGEEWRVHFHVPVFAARFGALGTTRDFLAQVLSQVGAARPLEVETYTWDVLPPELTTETVTDSIIRELLWTRDQLDAPHRRH